ncbi:hypothetical protein CGGC5_v017064 [Colletotrichum fructicola Nara gc5]|uniref:Uncharacterized protein n=1 Tax=Colletotrichum fructicola (strain Nara gc5) TaxID=1213859 RepID=A0A7J6IFJ6_COLFN|nr:hypothetical protein CGGC5_v017064 [Colletotrichum fructicola Nara gc5]
MLPSLRSGSWQKKWASSDFWLGRDPAVNNDYLPATRSSISRYSAHTHAALNSPVYPINCCMMLETQDVKDAQPSAVLRSLRSWSES